MIDIPTNVFSEAVREFWETRDRQMRDQEHRGGRDQGARSAVTGGQQMDGFLRVLTDLMVQAGLPRADIYHGRRLAELPGYFRATKDWDLVVVSGGVLRAAIELKSQVGPSFGNNFNNRTEEAMGTAVDIWTAFREGAFGDAPAPWLGYLLLLEDCEQSRRPVAVREPHFHVFEEFRGASYARRYEIFCRKLVRERQYSAACFIFADRTAQAHPANYIEPADDLSAPRFLRDLIRQIAFYPKHC